MQIHYPLISIRLKSLWFLTAGKVKRIYKLRVSGIFIRSDLDWHCRSNYIYQKINKSVFLIGKLNIIVFYEFYFPLTILVGMYTLISHMGQFCGPTGTRAILWFVCKGQEHYLRFMWDVTVNNLFSILKLFLFLVYKDNKRFSTCKLEQTQEYG